MIEVRHMNEVTQLHAFKETSMTDTTIIARLTALEKRMEEGLERQEDLLNAINTLSEQVEEAITKLDEMSFDSGSGFTTEYES